MYSNFSGRVISYVVASDTGLAPNIMGGICTLTVCKPVIRRVAKKGDLIVGFSTARDDRHKVIYAMYVDEKILYEDYFNDSRFQCKKPIYLSNGDNFFSKNQNQLQIAFKNAAHYGKEIAIQRDLKTPFSIVGKQFWYFGRNAPILPIALHGTKLTLNDTYRRGHRITTTPTSIDTLQKWLHHFPSGVHGKPRDLKPL